MYHLDNCEASFTFECAFSFSFGHTFVEQDVPEQVLLKLQFPGTSVLTFMNCFSL